MFRNAGVCFAQGIHTNRSLAQNYYDCDVVFPGFKRVAQRGHVIVNPVKLIQKVDLPIC